MTAIGLNKSTVVVNFFTKVTNRRRHSIPEGLHVWVMMELSSELHNYTKTWLPTDKTTSLSRRDVSSRSVLFEDWSLLVSGPWTSSPLTTKPQEQLAHRHMVIFQKTWIFCLARFFKIQFENNIEAKRTITLAILGWQWANACRLLYINQKA